MNDIVNFGQMSNDLFTEEEMAEIQREAIAEAEAELKEIEKQAIREAYKAAYKKAYMEAQRIQISERINSMKEKIEKTVFDAIEKQNPEAAAIIRQQQKEINKLRANALNKSGSPEKTGNAKKYADVLDNLDESSKQLIEKWDSKDVLEIDDIATEEGISTQEALDKKIGKDFDTGEKQMGEEKSTVLWDF